TTGAWVSRSGFILLRNQRPTWPGDLSCAAALSRPDREQDATRTGRAAHGGAGTPATSGVRSPRLGSSHREPASVDSACRITQPGPRLACSTRDAASGPRTFERPAPAAIRSAPLDNGAASGRPVPRKASVLHERRSRAHDEHTLDRILAGRLLCSSSAHRT